MKQEIAGKTIDTLTREELAAELRSAMEYFASGYLREPSLSRPEAGVALTAGGAGIADLFIVEVGMIFRLTRLFVTCNAATFGAPLANSGGIDVYRGSSAASDAIDGTPFTSLPQVATWSKSYAPTFRDGEIVRVGITGGPGSGQLFVRGMGFLEPLNDVADIGGNH